MATTRIVACFKADIEEAAALQIRKYNEKLESLQIMHYFPDRLSKQ
jgi:hypothetical protein